MFIECYFSARPDDILVCALYKHNNGNEIYYNNIIIMQCRD